jgi:hypothetical protein
MALASVPSLSAESFESLLANRAKVVCVRAEHTVIINFLESHLPPTRLQVISDSSSTNHAAATARQMMIDGECHAMAVPKWFADDVLVSEEANPSDHCDLRMLSPIEEWGGGWTVAQRWLREKGLDDGGGDPATNGAACSDVAADTLAILLSQLKTSVSGRPTNPNAKGIDRLRSEMIERGRTNRCNEDGSSASGEKGAGQGLAIQMYTGVFIILGGGIVLSFALATSVKSAASDLVRDATRARPGRSNKMAAGGPRIPSPRAV